VIAAAWVIVATAVVAYVIAFIAAIPPAGPIALLIADQSAAGDYRRARLVGLGAAIVEGAYAIAASRLFAVVSANVQEVRTTARVAAAFVLPALGSRFLFRNEPAKNIGPARSGRGKSILVGITVALLNPAPLVTWTTAVALLDSKQVTVDGWAVLAFGAGAALGVLSWNTLLVEILRKSAGRLPQARMAVVIRGLGFVLIAIGLWSAVALASGRS
jgi:threonine/homoserine/homoserine lactone efflux protein